MKKRIVCIVLAVLLAAVLFVPIPQGPYEDGGTRAYTALTYKVVQWNRITDYGNYNKTELYWLPHNSTFCGASKSGRVVP